MAASPEGTLGLAGRLGSLEPGRQAGLIAAIQQVFPAVHSLILTFRLKEIDNWSKI